ncbi:MAG TPA: hypothetical protein VGP17_14005 [Solirubrobacteraceae bacterium]|jgi:hypothetical protein|nr:hypothetical protein [Solirubrobacteraceae bacterium]
MPDEHPSDEPDLGILDREAVYLMTDPQQPAVWALADIGRELETHDPEAIVWLLVNAGPAVQDD